MSEYLYCRYMKMSCWTNISCLVKKKLSDFCQICKLSLISSKFICKSSFQKPYCQMKQNFLWPVLLIMILLGWSSFKIVSCQLAHHPRWPPGLLIFWKLEIFRTTGWNEIKFESKCHFVVTFQNCLHWTNPLSKMATI